MNIEERVQQIRASHASAKPTDANPAWKHTHADCTVLLKYIDQLTKQPQPALQHAYDVLKDDCAQLRDENKALAAELMRRSAQPAPMQVDRLPPLPPDDMHGLNQRGLYTAEQMHEYALAALASRAEHAVPAGWKLVPIEPTEDMIVNMCVAHEFSPYQDIEGPMRDAYAVMIAAAPSNKEVER